MLRVGGEFLIPSLTVIPARGGGSRSIESQLRLVAGGVAIKPIFTASRPYPNSLTQCPPLIRKTEPSIRITARARPHHRSYSLLNRTNSGFLVRTSVAKRLLVVDPHLGGAGTDACASDAFPQATAGIRKREAITATSARTPAVPVSAKAEARPLQRPSHTVDPLCCHERSLRCGPNDRVTAADRPLPSGEPVAEPSMALACGRDFRRIARNYLHALSAGCDDVRPSVLVAGEEGQEALPRPLVVSDTERSSARTPERLGLSPELKKAAFVENAEGRNVLKGHEVQRVVGVSGFVSVGLVYANDDCQPGVERRLEERASGPLRLVVFVPERSATPGDLHDLNICVLERRFPAGKLEGSIAPQRLVNHRATLQPVAEPAIMLLGQNGAEFLEPAGGLANAEREAGTL